MPTTPSPTFLTFPMRNYSRTRLAAGGVDGVTRANSIPEIAAPILVTPFTRSTPRSSDRRATLRDLYTSGLVSIFRRESVLRIWEPLRETPRRYDEGQKD